MLARKLFLLLCASLCLIGLATKLIPEKQQVLGESTHTTQIKFLITPQPWHLHQGSKLNVDQVQGTSLLLVDEGSGTILAERRPDQPRAMASITKIMTAALALEFTKPDDQITIPPQALANLPADSALAGISPGEKYTISELLYGMLLPSGNDAAQAVALAVSGTQSRFVSLMNAKAKQLNLTHTHFANPSGLDDPQQYTTATDLALLTHYARQFDLFRQIVDTPEKVLPASGDHKYLDLINANPFISIYPGATGVKPGNTGQAGNCLVATAERNGHHLIGILLDTPGRNTNMAALFDIGFAAEK